MLDRVLIDAAASAEEAERVRRALREAGLEAEVSTEWEKPQGVGNGAFWMVLLVLAVPASSFLTGLGKTLGERAGEAAWEGLKTLVSRLRQARSSSAIASDGWVELDDPEGTRIMIGDEADEADEAYEAYQQLLELDLDARRGWMLLWDDEAKEWYDPNRRSG